MRVRSLLRAADIDPLAELGLMSRDPEPTSPAGIGVDAAYHFFNVLQFGALLPSGREGIEALVQEVTECLEANDLEGAKGLLGDLKDKLEACESPPDMY